MPILRKLRALVEEGKLAADGTAAANNHALGFERQGHGLAVANDALAVLRHIGHHLAACARGDDDMRGFIHLGVAFGIGDFDTVAGFHTACAHDDIHVVLLQQELYALAHGLGHTARPLHHSRHVGLDRLCRHSICSRMVNIVEHLCALQQSLCGDATPVQTYPAEVLALDNSSLHA